MSADAWVNCPRCDSDRETMRLDYEVVPEGGNIYIELRASCVAGTGGCGFQLKYEDVVDLTASGGES